jgi:hypothetical protein
MATGTLCAVTNQGEGRSALRRVAVVGDAMTARVQVALLESAGIVAHLRGEALGPYPMTVGRFAEVEIWVAESDMEDAAAMLGGTGRHASPSGPTEAKSPSLVSPALAIAVALVLGLAVVLAAMRIF